MLGVSEAIQRLKQRDFVLANLEDLALGTLIKEFANQTPLQFRAKLRHQLISTPKTPLTPYGHHARAWRLQHTLQFTHCRSASQVEQSLLRAFEDDVRSGHISADSLRVAAEFAAGSVRTNPIIMGIVECFLASPPCLFYMPSFESSGGNLWPSSCEVMGGPEAPS